MFPNQLVNILHQRIQDYQDQRLMYTRQIQEMQQSGKMLENWPLFVVTKQNLDHARQCEADMVKQLTSLTPPAPEPAPVLFSPPVKKQPAPAPEAPQKKQKIEEEFNLQPYLDAKTQLASIFRDFTDNHIVFIGPDGHDIGMTEYQAIAKFTKAGEDPLNYMQGTKKVFKTGYNKKTNIYTENTLFIPKYRFKVEMPGDV